MKSNFLPLRRGAIRFAAALVPLTFVLGVAQVNADTESYNFVPLGNVPDGTTAGFADVHTLASNLASLTDVNVTLNLAGVGAGGFNGDLYVTLIHDTGFSVLLNRVGRTSIAPFGYSDQGFTITLNDQAANDVHSYRTTLFGNETTALIGTLTGDWKPDGRATDPFSTLATDPSTAALGSFNGTAGSGEWILFVADIERGATMQLTSWSLALTGTPFVPESSTPLAVIGLLGASGWLAWRNRRRD